MNKKDYKYYSLILLLVALPSCVTVFSPEIKSSDANKYVVSGQVTIGNQTQTVNISLASPISDTTYRPLTGCKVAIEDNESHNFPMVDLGDGKYSTLVNPNYLVPGHVFRVSVITPDGDHIISDYDTLQQVPPVDSITYVRKEVVSSVTGQSTEGLQFYIDLNGTNADSRYYRWVIYETWEYHARYPVLCYEGNDLKFHVLPNFDYSRYTCWHTREIPEIFTLSTASLSQNKYNKLPLQYVDNTTQKLFYGYSMLVEQFALSREAYNYWEQLQTNSTQEGGLYEKQPLSIRGNLHDITHPDKQVLGFFSSESVSYKRIFVGSVPGLPRKYVIPCGEHFQAPDFAHLPESAFPMYARWNTKHDTLFWLSTDCVNCMLQGGTTIKPSFWPK